MLPSGNSTQTARRNNYAQAAQKTTDRVDQAGARLHQPVARLAQHPPLSRQSGWHVNPLGKTIQTKKLSQQTRIHLVRLLSAFRDHPHPVGIDHVNVPHAKLLKIPMHPAATATCLKRYTNSQFGKWFENLSQGLMRGLTRLLSIRLPFPSITYK